MVSLYSVEFAFFTRAFSVFFCYPVSTWERVTLSREVVWHADLTILLVSTWENVSWQCGGGRPGVWLWSHHQGVGKTAIKTDKHNHSLPELETGFISALLIGQPMGLSHYLSEGLQEFFIVIVTLYSRGILMEDHV